MKKNTTIVLSLQQQLQIGSQLLALEDIFALLEALKNEKNLRTAADNLGYSYRKAWNLINNLEGLLELPLVLKERGRGTCLTAFGGKFLEILQDNQQLLNSALNRQAQIASRILQEELKPLPVLKIIASDNAKLCALRTSLSLSLEIAGSMNALKAYAQGECAIAGFHLPCGELGEKMLSRYRPFLEHEDYRFVLIDSREQGLLSQTGHSVHDLIQLVDEGLRFVNRQRDSGTRDLLDLLLQQMNIEPQSIKGYQHEEHTHLAVASLIVAGEADAGLGIRSVAERLHLHFQPLVAEYYFLLVSQSQLEQKQVQQLLESLGNVSERDVFDYLGLKQKIGSQISETFKTS